MSKCRIAVKGETTMRRRKTLVEMSDLTTAVNHLGMAESRLLAAGEGRLASRVSALASEVEVILNGPDATTGVA
jgi:hypothetical protein